MYTIFTRAIVQKDVANLKQQRLKSKEFILNPTSTIITLFVIGLLFAPIGGVLVWGSGLVRLCRLTPRIDADIGSATRTGDGNHD